VQLPKEKIAKLPLPPAEIDRITRHRGILAHLIAKGTGLALAIEEDAMQEIAARKAARAAASTAQATAHASPRAPSQSRQPTPRAAAAETPQTPAREPAPASAEPNRRAIRANPEAAFFYVVRAINLCMRTDEFLAEKLARGHTTADLAGLNHPNRQPILDYLHKAARLYHPYQLQRMTHIALETRITEELAWAPDRAPGDIIAEIATQFGLEHNPADYPNNWRPVDFDSTPYDAYPDWPEPEVEPLAPKPALRPKPEDMFQIVLAERGAHGEL
jgi:hypothetical protein